MSQSVRSVAVISHGERVTEIQIYLVIVPSISETTTKSVESHTKILAVQTIAPVIEREKVILLAPGFRFNVF